MRLYDLMPRICRLWGAQTTQRTSNTH